MMNKQDQKKVRVCIVAASLDILGGQAVQAKRLLDDMASESAVEASFIPVNPRLPGALGKLQRIKYVRTLVTSITYFAILLIRLPRVDVVHVFSASYLSFLIAPVPAILIAKLYGKPVLLNYHSGEAEDHLNRWRRVALPLMRLADRIIVPSGYLVDVFAKFGLKASAIFNTVDFSAFRFRARRPLRPVLLSNRNLESHYNVACALRAFAAVQEQIESAELIVAGTGSLHSSLVKLAADLGLRNVEFVGAIAPSEMPALYDRADIFINASDIDNMPLSIIEAFACGLPVVTTDAGGIPFIVTHCRNGILAPRGDYESLARWVIAMVENDDFAEQLASTAGADCQRYTWSAVRSDWLNVYKELAGHTSAHFEKRMDAAIEAGGEIKNG